MHSLTIDTVPPPSPKWELYNSGGLPTPRRTAWSLPQLLAVLLQQPLLQQSPGGAIANGRRVYLLVKLLGKSCFEKTKQKQKQDSVALKQPISQGDFCTKALDETP